MDHQPRPGGRAQKGARDRLIRLLASHPAGALGFSDATGGSRTARPARRAWAPADQPWRLIEQAIPKEDPDPQAPAASGLLVRTADAAEPTGRRCVDGRPLSAVTLSFLDWCCAKLEARGKTALLRVWDNASWHLRPAVRAGIRDHHRQVRREGQGGRLPGPLPITSAWLNPIEPHWIHTPRRIVEPARLLTAPALEDRVCEAWGCPHENHLIIPAKVA